MSTSTNLVSLANVTKLNWLPARRGGGRLSLSTVWRWCLKGVKARDGAIIKLRAVRVGDCLCTSEQWLHDFFDALTSHDPALTGNDNQPSIRTAAQRQRASVRAEKQLDQIGI